MLPVLQCLGEYNVGEHLLLFSGHHSCRLLWFLEETFTDYSWILHGHLLCCMTFSLYLLFVCNWFVLFSEIQHFVSYGRNLLVRRMEKQSLTNFCLYFPKRILTFIFSWCCHVKNNKVGKMGLYVLQLYWYTRRPGWSDFSENLRFKRKSWIN